VKVPYLPALNQPGVALKADALNETFYALFEVSDANDRYPPRPLFNRRKILIPESRLFHLETKHKFLILS
jgi:hypothetical protein